MYWRLYLRARVSCDIEQHEERRTLLDADAAEGVEKGRFPDVRHACYEHGNAILGAFELPVGHPCRRKLQHAFDEESMEAELTQSRLEQYLHIRIAAGIRKDDVLLPMLPQRLPQRLPSRGISSSSAPSPSRPRTS